MSDAFHAYLQRPSRRRLSRVVEEFHEHVWRVGLRISGNEPDAEDICQNVFLALLLRPPAAGSVRSPRGYLTYRVLAMAQQADRAAARRRKRQLAAFQRMAPSGVRADGADTLEDVREAMAGCSERVRSVLELKYFGGCTIDEIAETLDVSPRTVASDLQRGRDELRGRLGEGIERACLLPAGLTFQALPKPPATLLPELQKVIQWTPSLSAATPVLGAVIMKKLALSASGALVLLLLIGGGVGLLVMKSKEPPGPGAIGVLRSAATPAPSRESVAAVPEPAATTRPTTEAAPAVGLRGSITISVKNEEGQPVEAARVECLRSAAKVTTLKTGADGSVTFGELALGIYGVRVFAGGYARRSVESLELTEAVSNLATDVTLKPGYSVLGLASDPAGRPVEGCSLVLSPLEPSDGWRFEERVVSGSDGTFRFHQLEMGTYVATGQKEGYDIRLFPTPHSLPFMALGESRIEFAFRQKRECRLDAVVYRGVALSGVVMSLGSPVPRASITLQYDGPNVTWQAPIALSRREGAYRAAGLIPGLYRFIVVAPGCRPLRGELELPEAHGAEDAYERDFELESGGVISGTLVRDGRPVRGEITAFRLDDSGKLKSLGVAGTTRSSETGAFSFIRVQAGKEPVPDGTYILRGLDTSLYAGSVGGGVGVKPLESDVKVEIRDRRGASGVVVEAHSGAGAIRGRIVNPEGQPVPRASIYCRTRVGGWTIEHRDHPANEQGRFVIESVPAGEVELRIRPLDGEFKPRTVERTVGPQKSFVDVGDVVLESAGKRTIVIRVAYADPDADPEPGVVDVGLRRVGTSENHYARVMGGKATFEGLDAAVYQPSVDFSVHVEPRLEPIDLTTEEHVELKVVADPGITVSGGVAIEDGFPLQGSGGDFWLPVKLRYAEGGTVQRIARVEGDRYRIQGLRAGLVTGLRVVGAPRGERAFYVDLPGFVVGERNGEISLGHIRRSE